VNAEFRKPFDDFAKGLVNVSIVKEGTLFDYNLVVKADKKESEWVRWSELIGDFGEYPK
jgi:hypothetical protein